MDLLEVVSLRHPSEEIYAESGIGNHAPVGVFFYGKSAKVLDQQHQRINYKLKIKKNVSNHLH